MADIIIQDFTDNLTQKLGEIRSVDDVLDLFTITIKGGDVTVIPNTGLEAITLPEPCDPTEKAPSETLNIHVEGQGVTINYEGVLPNQKQHSFFLFKSAANRLLKDLSL